MCTRRRWAPPGWFHANTRLSASPHTWHEKQSVHVSCGKKRTSACKFCQVWAPTQTDSRLCRTADCGCDQKGVALFCAQQVVDSYEQFISRGLTAFFVFLQRESGLFLGVFHCTGAGHPSHAPTPKKSEPEMTIPGRERLNVLPPCLNCPPDAERQEKEAWHNVTLKRGHLACRSIIPRHLESGSTIIICLKLVSTTKPGWSLKVLRSAFSPHAPRDSISLEVANSALDKPVAKVQGLERNWWQCNETRKFDTYLH